jgi:hypothetical protein
MDEWNKLLEYVTNEEDRYYEFAHQAMQENNMIGNMVNMAQATAFQRVRYYMEEIKEIEKTF